MNENNEHLTNTIITSNINVNVEHSLEKDAPVQAAAIPKLLDIENNVVELESGFDFTQHLNP